MASRSLDDLHPLMHAKALEFLSGCAREGLDVLIYCTHRSLKEQADLYNQGRNTPGRVVTKAKPGQSAHNFTVDGKPAALAFDGVPLKNGKPCWDMNDELWKPYGVIAGLTGLQWYGHPGSEFREFPHVQWPKLRRDPITRNIVGALK